MDMINVVTNVTVSSVVLTRSYFSQDNKVSTCVLIMFINNNKMGPYKTSMTLLQLQITDP